MRKLPHIFNKRKAHCTICPAICSEIIKIMIPNCVIDRCINPRQFPLLHFRHFADEMQIIALRRIPQISDCVDRELKIHEIRDCSRHTFRGTVRKILLEI